MSGPRRGFTLIELLVVMAMIGVLAAFLRPVLLGKLEQRDRVACSNNLRVLALAAIHYADNRRFYPHVRRVRELDGDVETNHATRSYRALLWYGYLDDPQALICPASADAVIPVNDPAVQADARRWFWGGARVEPGPSPWSAPAADPALIETGELSYGWTRKAYNMGVRSSAILAADRAVRGAEPSGKPGARGNHTDGWNVVTACAEVRFVQPSDLGQGGQRGVAWLRSTETYGGYLAIVDRSP